MSASERVQKILEEVATLPPGERAQLVAELSASKSEPLTFSEEDRARQRKAVLEFLAIPTFSSKSDDPLRTAFDNFFDEQMADPAVAEAYHEARSQIDVIDQFVRVMKLAADAISTVPEGRSHAELLVRHFPWVRFLPDEDRSLFERSFVETLLACVSLDNFAKLEELLGDWKATALIHADPELAADLKKLIPDDDQ